MYDIPLIAVVSIFQCAEASAAMDVIEHLLNGVYILPAATKNLLKRKMRDIL